MSRVMDDAPPARPAKKLIRQCDLAGFKYFQLLLPLLDTLHEQACIRDKAHNRTLHYDQYATLLLLFFFNPIITSTRGLIQAGKLLPIEEALANLGNPGSGPAPKTPQPRKPPPPAPATSHQPPETRNQKPETLRLAAAVGCCVVLVGLLTQGLARLPDHLAEEVGGGEAGDDVEIVVVNEALDLAVALGLNR